MEENNILMPNINTQKEEEKENKSENIKQEEKITLPDWDLTPPFETIDRSAL